MKKHLIILALAIGASSSLLLAEDPKDAKPGDGPRAGGRPTPPWVVALDLNKDGVIDAEELAKAGESLKKLDKNGDGKLTEDEYHPQRPPGGPGGPGGERPDGQKNPGPGGPGGKKPDETK